MSEKESEQAVPDDSGDHQVDNGSAPRESPEPSLPPAEDNEVAHEVDNLFSGDEEEEDNKKKAPAVADDDDEEEELDEDNIFGEEEEQEGENEQEQGSSSEIEELRAIDLSIPRFESSHETAERVFTARVPPFLNIEPQAFDADVYIGDAGAMQDADGARNAVENTVRWRYDPSGALDPHDGLTKKQSNARIIKWSDGSLSLKLGAEMFDIATKPAPNTFLTVSHAAQEVLQTAAVVTDNANIVPTSTSSASHKRLTQQLAKKQVRHSGVRNFATLEDPERIKRDAEKAEESKLKARRKLEQIRARDAGDEAGETGGAITRRSSLGAGIGSRHGGADTGEYERDDFVVSTDDEEEEAQSDDEEEEEEEEDLEEIRAARLRDVKRSGTEKYKKRQSSDDEEQGQSEQVEEEQQQEAQDSASDSDEQMGSRKGKRRRIVGDGDEDED